MIAVTASGLGSLKVFDTYQERQPGGALLAENVEALAGGEDDYSDCPRATYQRAATEAWAYLNVKADADGGVYIRYQGRKISLGAGAHAGGSVALPICKDSMGNCCKKSHLNSNPNIYSRMTKDVKQ